MNTAECDDSNVNRRGVAHASMGPPREHGGMGAPSDRHAHVETASMGPPREHGGMAVELRWNYVNTKLQWGSRVNTAECTP